MTTSQTPAWSPTPSDRAAPGAVIGGRYALRAAVGTGGMGAVWRASDTLLRREVAVKEVVCPPGLAPSDRDAMYERTMREARAAAALSHPSVVQVYDVVTEGGRPWIVMELLDARSLADMVIEDGPLAPRAVAKIGIALLGALEVAHAAGVLHRDVKPANVLICADGRCVLTDFGVARMPTDVQLTTPGMVLGSPHFISPERAMGHKFGPPSDLFSLGVSLYTAVEGRPPFDRGDPIETMHAVVEDQPAPPVRAGPLTGVLHGLLEKDPARRWDVPRARAVLRDLITGPLATKARDHVTDPYAVVPPQRSSEPPAVVQSGQIGGRAMVAPDESLTDAIARARAETSAGPARGAWTTVDTGTWVESGTAWVRPGARWGGSAADQTAAGHPAGAHPPANGQGQDTAGHPAAFTGAATGQWSAAGSHPAGPAGGHPPGSTSGPLAEDAAASRSRAATRGTRRRATGVGAGLLDTLRRWPPRTRILAGSGTAAILLLSVLAVTGDWFGGAPTSAGQGAQPSTAASSAPRQPLLDVQEHRQGPMILNVPAGWRKSAVNSYVDYVDPEVNGRKVRINIETATATPRRFLETAERGLRRPSNCASYSRVDLRDATLDGQPAAELEYTCGQGEGMRHGVWRAIVVAGKAYHFYLTVPDPRFEDSRMIFEEMVRSFRLTA